MAEKNLFVARFAKGSQHGDGEWPYTIVSGSSRADSTGHVRIDLRIQDVLLALSDGHLHIEMGEQAALKLAQTITTVGEHLTTLRDLHQKGSPDPSAYVEAEDAPPAGIPFLSLSPMRQRELLWEASGHINNIQQSADNLFVEIRTSLETVGSAQGQLTFSGCRFVTLRPSGSKIGSRVRLSKLKGSPFLMLAAFPETVSHFIVETGDDDVCDVIASSYEVAMLTK